MSRNELKNGRRCAVLLDQDGETFRGAINVVDGAHLLIVRGARQVQAGKPIWIDGEAWSVTGEHTTGLANARLYSLAK